MSSIDIVIPCYNYGRFLEQCVDSVLNQEGVDVRILIVDDESRDETPLIGQRLAALDRRITYHRNPHNMGLVATANVGIMNWARAKYTLLLSADDGLADGALARAASVMDQHDHVALTYGFARVIPATYTIKREHFDPTFDYVVLSGPDFLRQCCLHWCGVASPTALIRTSVHHEVGAMDPRFLQTCDVEIWMRLATRASIAAINTVQAYYRRHEANMSTAFMSRPLSDLQEQYDTVHTVLTEHSTNRREAAQLMAQLDTRLITQAGWMAGLAFERGDMAGVRDCAAFASKIGGSTWTSAAWAKFRVRQLMGRKAAKTLRGLRGGPAETRALAGDFDPFKVGELFGWWPEQQPVNTMTARA